ncbi:MAG: hypothetical protein EOP87_09125 [Verrucomicrobiaceae bacterium]|nr:MAG: hypothetical protein EOP87_09125 [Verrucomicrobiaceae bacterium]
MFSASKLTPEQKDSLHTWAAEGATISDLQKRLKDEFDLSISYMDARFLVLDLDLKLQETKKEEEKKPEAPAPVPTGTVDLTMDQVALPGALVSGRVTFSDGESGIWMLDQTGRPALDTDTPGYHPSPEDVTEFQTKLRDVIQKSGL